MRKRFMKAQAILATIMIAVALSACGSPRQVEGEGAITSDSPEAVTMGTSFNDNRTPASAFFGDRTYAQREFNRSALRDEHVSGTDAGSYTVMIYLDGSTNLEDPNYDYTGSILGSTTIDAILASGVDPERVNVVIMTGGSDSWGHSGLEGNGNYILHIVEDDDGNGLSARVDYHSEEPLNMGDPETLGSFVDFAADNYPADHFALMIWDHGNGPLYGCAVDENYNRDSLLLPEIDKALGATEFGKSKMFDWIGFDCCLMGDLEVADILAKYSYYMIASQELEAGFSGKFAYGTAWVYSFLELLNTTASPTTIAAGAIDQYADGKELASSDGNTRTTYTMSLMDLAEVEAVETALDRLFHKMADDLDAGEFANLARLREYTKEYNEGEGLDIVDLGYMAWTLEEMYPDESKDLTKAIEGLVLYQRTNVPEASGVSLYYPYRNEELYINEGGREVYEQLSVSEGYLTYLEKFMDILANGDENTDWDIGAPTPDSEGDGSSSSDGKDAGEYTVRLSGDQMEGIVRISYNILKRGTDEDAWSGGRGRYRMLLQDCQIAQDADGVLHIPKNQPLLTLSDKSGEKRVWPFKQVAAGAQTAKYQSLATSIEGPFGALAWTDSTPVTITVTESLGGGGLAISSINYRDEEDRIEGKSDVDIERYDFLANWVQPTAPNDGDPEPAWNWEMGSGFVGEQLHIDSQLAIGTAMTSELEGDYYVQIVFTDANGNEYASELYELDSLGNPSVEQTEIDGINCTFNVYENYVVLAKVEGDAAEFAVPAEYQGKPVTEIGHGAFYGTKIRSVIIPEGIVKISGAFSGNTLESVSLPEGLKTISPSAFSGCSNLTDIKLPQSLERIGDSAFARCEKLAVLEIPARVTYIGDGAFQECSRLRRLTVAEGNKAFKVEKNDDGNVLYTYDGTELIACPSLFHSEYKVAEGTVRIRDRAFYGCYTESMSGKADGSEGHNVVGYGLVRIEFPSTLKEIGDAAFFECNRLEDINLPDGLEIIGTEAFGSTDFTGTLGLGTIEFEKDTIQRVVIGKEVRWIGPSAFNSFNVERFVVEDDNEHYSEKDGKLMSKDGQTAIDVYGD